MDPIKPTIEFLLKKNWINLLIAVICSFAIILVFPNVTDQVPFESHDIRVVVAWSIVTIALFIVLEFVRWFIKSAIKISNSHKARNKQKNYSEEANKEAIEKIKQTVDNWTDFDYSVVMYLIKNENKKPFCTHSFYMNKTILDNDMVFLKTRTFGEVKEKVVIKGEATDTIYKGEITKYLLKDEVYQQLKAILDQTGSISHFERHIIDIGNEEDLAHE